MISIDLLVGQPSHLQQSVQSRITAIGYSRQTALQQCTVLTIQLYQIANRGKRSKRQQICTGFLPILTAFQKQRFRKAVANTRSTVLRKWICTIISLRIDHCIRRRQQLLPILDRHRVMVKDHNAHTQRFGKFHLFKSRNPVIASKKYRYAAGIKRADGIYVQTIALLLTLRDIVNHICTKGA